MLPCPEKYSPLASIRLISSSGKTVRGPRSRHDAMHVEASWYPGCADIQVCRNIPKRPPGLSFSGLRGHAHLRKYHRQLRLSREHFRYCSLAHVFGLVQMNSYKNSRPKKKKIQSLFVPFVPTRCTPLGISREEDCVSVGSIHCWVKRFCFYSQLCCKRAL